MRQGTGKKVHASPHGPAPQGLSGYMGSAAAPRLRARAKVLFFSIQPPLPARPPTRTGRQVASSGLRTAPSLHPEHPELRLRDRRVERSREGQPEHAARLLRRDDAVVPQPRRGVIGIALGLVAVADRLLERLLFLGRPGA